MGTGLRLLTITCISIVLLVAGMPGDRVVAAQPYSTALQFARKSLGFVEKSADNNQTVLIEDLDPCYLPDGGFAFVSTRSQNFGRCHFNGSWPSNSAFGISPMGQSLTIANYDHNKLYRINEKGEIIWDFNAKQCVDFEIYPNGNILFSDGKGVKIVTPDKKVILDYHAGGSEVWGCLYMPNGNILVGHNNERKVVEIDKNGNKISEFSIISKAGGHDVMREMTLTAQNTVLIGHKGDKVAREYDLKGNMVNEFGCPGYVQHAKRLPNGNTLVTWKHGVWEFDKQKQVVWKLDKADVPEINIKWLIRSQRLPNGNTIISNWSIKQGEGHAIFTVNKEKKVIWKSPQSQLYVGTSSIHVAVPDRTSN